MVIDSSYSEERRPVELDANFFVVVPAASAFRYETRHLAILAEDLSSDET